MSNEQSRDPAAQEGDVARSRQIVLVENRVDSRSLFLGTREITIVHGEDRYRLRLTAQNKLILTK